MNGDMKEGCVSNVRGRACHKGLPNKKGAARPSIPPKEKTRAYQKTLDETTIA